MRFNTGCILTEIRDIRKEEAIAVGFGGLLIGSTIIHSEMISAMSSIITKAVENGIGIWQHNLTIDSSMGKLIAASASPSTILIHQKNGHNAGMRKERSRFEIIEDMLTVLTEKKLIKKTQILQGTNLNWRDSQRYFDFLLEENFIAKCNNSGAGSYEITEKGRELMKGLKKIKELLS